MIILNASDHVCCALIGVWLCLVPGFVAGHMELRARARLDFCLLCGGRWKGVTLNSGGAFLDGAEIKKVE